MKKLNVAIIGAKFMGKAHSSSWSRVHRFFDVPFEPVLKVACGRPGSSLESFGNRWGWESISSDWQETVNNPDVDIVDIAAPTYLHHDIAIEAAKAGKHVFCEKPIGLSQNQAVEMYDAAEKAGSCTTSTIITADVPRSRSPSGLSRRVGSVNCSTGAQRICRAGSWIRSFLLPGTCARKRPDPVQTLT